jgi:hypothetical protein
LYDVGEGLQLRQGPSVEGNVKHFNIDGACETYPAADETERDRDIVIDDRESSGEG